VINVIVKAAEIRIAFTAIRTISPILAVLYRVRAGPTGADVSVDMTASADRGVWNRRCAGDRASTSVPPRSVVPG
jgi:hypothetical protein